MVSMTTLNLFIHQLFPKAWFILYENCESEVNLLAPQFGQQCIHCLCHQNRFAFAFSWSINKGLWNQKHVICKHYTNKFVPEMFRKHVEFDCTLLFIYDHTQQKWKSNYNRKLKSGQIKIIFLVMMSEIQAAARHLSQDLSFWSTRLVRRHIRFK